MNAVLIILTFLWCGPSEAMCEDGFIIHDSCATAETWLRAGLRAGQEVHVQKCEDYAGWQSDD